MKNFIKGKFATVLILIVTVALAGIAIFTAFRLYQLRQESVAPNAPSSVPHAQEVTATATPKSCSLLTFSLTTSSPTPTPAAPVCGSKCDIQSSGVICPSGLTCYQGVCRKQACLTETDCVCPGVTPTPTPTATPTATPTSAPGSTATPTPPPGAAATATARPIAQATATPEAALPVAGIAWPTIAGFTLGGFVLILAFILAL